MITKEYRVVTPWRLKGHAEDVRDLIARPETLAQWWPSTFLRSELIEEGDAHLIGRTVRLHTKGWLPYTIQITARIEENDFPRRLVTRTWGDLIGLALISGTVEEDQTVMALLDWRVKIRKTSIALLAPLFAPFLIANHRYAMKCGEKSMNLELERREFLRSHSPDQAWNRPPKGPTWPHSDPTFVERYRWKEMVTSPPPGEIQ